MPFGIILGIFAAISQIAYEKIDLLSFTLHVKVLFFIGIMSFINQNLWIRGFQLGKQGVLTLLHNLQIVYTFVFEIIYLNEVPGWFSIIGSILVIISCLKLGLDKSK